MKTYTICGSMRFEKEMREIAFLLETQKECNILQCTYADRGVSEEEKRRITEAHYRKIDLSDGIYVLNIDGYIGDSAANTHHCARQPLSQKSKIFDSSPYTGEPWGAAAPLQ